jgi:hypothetical protein
MSRGGKRRGAGRPKGSTNKTRFEQPEQREHYAHVRSPLDHLLATMRDPHADWRRRDRAAREAAPYCHAKITSDANGKKQAAEAAAQTAVQP